MKTFFALGENHNYSPFLPPLEQRLSADRPTVFHVLQSFYSCVRFSRNVHVAGFRDYTLEKCVENVKIGWWAAVSPQRVLSSTVDPLAVSTENERVLRSERSEAHEGPRHTTKEGDKLTHQGRGSLNDVIDVKESEEDVLSQWLAQAGVDPSQGLQSSPGGSAAQPHVTDGRKEVAARTALELYVDQQRAYYDVQLKRLPWAPTPAYIEHLEKNHRLRKRAATSAV